MLKRPDQSKPILASLAGFGAAACLVATPVLAVKTASTAYDFEIFGEKPGQRALDLTASEINQRLAALIPHRADRQAYWEGSVEAALDEGDLPIARGWLLAAPDILKDPALRAEDEDLQIVRSVEHLRPDLGFRYRQATSPIGRSAAFLEAAAEGAVSGRPDSAAHLAGAVTADFLVVGDIRDLAIQGKAWADGGDPDWFLFGVSAAGLALTAATVASAGGAAPPKAGVSALKSAKRADRLSPNLIKHFETSAQHILNGSGLRGAARTGRRTDDLMDSVRRAVRSDAAVKLGDDVAQISALSKRLGPAGAIDVLEHVETATDLRRARLLTEAGGDRALVLLKRTGPKALRAAKVGVKWSSQLYAEIAALAAAIAGLFISAGFSMMRYFGRRALKDQVSRTHSTSKKRGLAVAAQN